MQLPLGFLCDLAPPTVSECNLWWAGQLLAWQHLQSGFTNESDQKYSHVHFFQAFKHSSEATYFQTESRHLFSPSKSFMLHGQLVLLVLNHFLFVYFIFSCCVNYTLSPSSCTEDPVYKEQFSKNYHLICLSETHWGHENSLQRHKQLENTCCSWYI